MVKYAPRKVYIKENGGYVELSYTDFCRRRQADQSYMDKLFIPVQGCLLEVVREQYAEFYKDKERWRYLKKLDMNNSLISLEGFTDGEGNVLDFIVDEAMDRNLPNELKGTAWQYCPIADFYSHFHEPMQALPFLRAFLKHPRLEHLVKVGFWNIVSDLAYRHHPDCLDETQNRTHRILKVPKTCSS